MALIGAAAQADSATSPPSPALAASPLAPDEAKRALGVLNNADRRAKLIDTLQAIAKAFPTLSPAAEPAPAPTRIVYSDLDAVVEARQPRRRARSSGGSL